MFTVYLSAFVYDVCMYSRLNIIQTHTHKSACHAQGTQLPHSHPLATRHRWYVLRYAVCVCSRSNYSNVIRTSPLYVLCVLPDFNTVRVGAFCHPQTQAKQTTMRAFASVCSVVYTSAKTTIFILLNLIKKIIFFDLPLIIGEVL